MGGPNSKDAPTPLTWFLLPLVLLGEALIVTQGLPGGTPVLGRCPGKGGRPHLWAQRCQRTLPSGISSVPLFMGWTPQPQPSAPRP